MKHGCIDAQHLIRIAEQLDPGLIRGYQLVTKLDMIEWEYKP